MATENTGFDKYITPIAFVLGALIIALALMFGRGGAPTDNTGGTPAAVDINDVKTDTSPSVGDQNAPVTIAVWFDYQCPFCQRFELQTMKPIYDEYVTSGQVRIVYKDYQFLGPDSIDTALFARGVYEAYPNRFHEWLMAVMSAQDGEQGGFGDLASVTALTRTLEGIDADRVLSLVEQNRTRYLAALEADKAEGVAFGISGTPGAIIGTTLVAGAQPYAQVKALVDAELAK